MDNDNKDPLTRVSSKSFILDDAFTKLAIRLEAATSRLEDIASSTFEKTGAPNAAPIAATTAAAPPSAPGAPAPTAPAKEELPAMIEAFDALLNSDLKDFVERSKRFGGTIAEQAQALAEAFAAQRQYLLVSTKAKKPDMASTAFLELLKDLQGAMEKVDQIKQVSKELEIKNHLTMVADGVGVLAWVTMEVKPGDTAAELFGGAQMYGNKVLKEYKEKGDKNNVEWVQSFYKLFKSLIAYIKEHHPRGVRFNSNGIDAAEALRQVKSDGTNGVPPPAPGAAAGGVPPPPPPPLPNFDNVPPPPPPPPAGGPPGNRAGQADMGAVFEELNKGEAITSSLRKVDDSMKTHKNPSLRASTVVPERSDSLSARSKSPAPPGKKPKPDAFRAKKPEKKVLDGNKWIIENFDNPPAPIEIEATIVQSILISRCKNTTIRIIGKANAISIDNSVRASIILDSLVSAVDVIKCPNFALQVLGTLPTIMLDQVDGAAVYLSRESLNTEVFTSKCTSVNVNLPPREGDEDGDYAEMPIPEQVRSFVRNGKLVSEIVEHAG
ncbi:adenylyl cyclase-associated protein [Phyllosticta citriasiana]|uniref:adenylyl cyclase-associated protein n=1 Tax=Phyllosticta citriasiana TaxID=595635 RepID=UPI0030FD2EA1